MGQPDPVLRAASIPDGQGSSGESRHRKCQCRPGWRYRPLHREGPAIAQNINYIGTFYIIQRKMSGFQKT